MDLRFQDLQSYKLTAALADELYGEGKRWFRSDREVLGLGLIDKSAQTGALIARATGYESMEDIGAHIAQAIETLSTLRLLLSEAENRGLLREGMRDRVDEIDAALRRDFPEVITPRRPPAAPSAGA